MNEIDNDNQNSDQPQPEATENLKSQLAAQTERADRIEARFKEHLLTSGLERAAVRGRAFNPAQVIALLKPRTELVQAADKEGKPIDGQFDLLVRTEGGDTLTPREAIDSLRKSDPNFFLSPSDLALDSAAKTGESNFQRMARLAKTNPAEYHRLRQEQPELIGLRRKRR